MIAMALPHPAGELVRIAVEVHGVDGDEPEHLTRALLDLRLGHVRVGAAGVAHLLGDRQHRIERVHRALHHDREVAPADPPQLALLEQDEVAPLEEHAPADNLARQRRAEQARDRVQEGRLPAARLADDREELAARELEVDVVDGDDRALESAASAAAVVRAARDAGARLRSARSVFAAAAAGDSRAREVVATEAAIVARALTAVVAVVDPELIVLGGGIGRAPGFAEEVGARLAELSPVVPDVRPSALGEGAVVDGCLAVGSDQLWQRILSSRLAAETE